MSRVNDDVDDFMLMTIRRCFWQNHYVGDLFVVLVTGTNFENWSLYWRTVKVVLNVTVHRGHHRTTRKIKITCEMYHQPSTFFVIFSSIHYLIFESTQIFLVIWNNLSGLPEPCTIRSCGQWCSKRPWS